MAGGARGLVLGQTPPGGGGRQPEKTCSNEHILRSGQRIPPGRIHPPQESSYFRGCGRYLGCHRRNSAKLPKCTRTDTDTTADPLNSRHCFQVLLCPEQTWREAPHPFRDWVLFPNDLFASALTMSRCVQGHICILIICSPRAIHPPFVRPYPSTHPLARRCWYKCRPNYSQWGPGWFKCGARTRVRSDILCGALSG